MAVMHYLPIQINLGTAPEHIDACGCQKTADGTSVNYEQTSAQADLKHWENDVIKR
jgi:hypothetical protein